MIHQISGWITSGRTSGLIHPIKIMHYGVIYLGVIFTSMLLSLTSRVIILANNSHFFFHLLDMLLHHYSV